MTLTIIAWCVLFASAGFTACLCIVYKRHIAHLDNDIDDMPDDAVKVGEAILERGRATLAGAYPAVTSDVEVYKLTSKDGIKRFIERDI